MAQLHSEDSTGNWTIKWKTKTEDSWISTFIYCCDSIINRVHSLHSTSLFVIFLSATYLPGSVSVTFITFFYTFTPPPLLGVISGRPPRLNRT